MDIKVTETFEKEIINLKKRFINIDKDFEILLKQLINNPKSGKPLGKKFFKIRLKNSDIHKGKSSGYRVITYLIEHNTIYLITIYYKGDKDTISNDEILEIAKREKLI